MQATRVFSVNPQKTAHSTDRRRNAGQNAGEPKGNDPGEKKVLYIYDRVTTRKAKEREMKHRFGSAYQRHYIPRNPQQNRPPSGYAGKSRYNGNPEQGNRPRAAAFAGTREFSPGSGGAAVKKRSRLLIDNIINLFESIEERWIRDLDIAKKQAMLRKKLVEHRRGICLALVILAILTVFVIGVYKLFFVIRHMEAEGSAVYTAAEIMEASGVELGDNLYSFRADDTADSITFHCPYLKSAQITRTIPTQVSILVEDDTARYYADFYGETVALSAGLKVLGAVDDEEAKAQGLTLLKLPAVDKAVAGRVIQFADAKDERYIRELLTNVTDSALAERINMIDMRDPFDIIMNCDNTYRFQFGSTADAVLKLRMAEKTLNDSLFEKGTLARIDLSTTGEASVRYDLRLNLDE